MPFLAEDEKGRAVDAEHDQVDPNKDYNCPSCGNTLRYRREATTEDGDTIRRAHFWHTGNVGSPSGIGGCGVGGESARHEEIKREVVQTLREEYPDAEIQLEKQIGDNVADVVVEYDEVYGEPDQNPLGAVVEVQVANQSKEYLDVTKNYLRNEFGVYWVFCVSDGYSMLTDAIHEFGGLLEPPVHFGEADDEVADLGRRIYFENFDYRVSSLKDEVWGVPDQLLGNEFGLDRFAFGKFAVGNSEYTISHERTKPAKYGKTRPPLDEWEADKLTLSRATRSLTEELDYPDSTIQELVEDGRLYRVSPYPISEGVGLGV